MSEGNKKENDEGVRNPSTGNKEEEPQMLAVGSAPWYLYRRPKEQPIPTRAGQRSQKAAGYLIGLNSRGKKN